MAEQRSSEADDEGAHEHRVLWEIEPAKHPSSRPPPPHAPAHAHAPAQALTRATVRMTRHELTKTARLPPYQPPPRIVSEVARQAVREAPRRASLASYVPRAVPSRPWTDAIALDPRLHLLTDPDSARAAAFRTLRDNLLASGMPRVLAVTSAEAHDGKTTCALNLAIALAEQPTTRVLLVDANFFVPALAQVFGIDEHTPAEPSPHLPWVAPFKVSELTPYLHVATIVQRRGEPLSRLDKQRLGLVLSRMCGMGYDHLVLDAPAIAGSQPALQLLAGADGVLMVVRAGHTTARALRRAMGQLSPGKVLGSALMDVRE